MHHLLSLQKKRNAFPLTGDDKVSKLSVSGLKSVFFCSFCRYILTQPIIAFIDLSKPMSNFISTNSSMLFFFRRASLCLGVPLDRYQMKFYINLKKKKKQIIFVMQLTRLREERCR